jgi:predicted phosphodiesterase
MGKQGLAGKLVVEYINKYPSITKRGLAKILFEENKKVFKDLEHARSVIKKYTNEGYGNSVAKGLLNGNYERILKGIPQSEAETHVQHEIKGSKKILVISDIHIPYHDYNALKTALIYGKKQGVDIVYINGDLLDFHQISRHDKDPRKRDTAYEIDACKQFLKALRELFDKEEIVWYFGNHDHRFRKYVWQFAPQLMGLQECDLPYFLGLRELNIKWIENDRGTKCGNLDIFHGHEWKGSGGAFPARSYHLKAKKSILVGHVHRHSVYTDKNVRGSVSGSFSTGCLCELSPDYFPFNDHVHGFTIVNLSKDGSFVVENKMIIDGKVI